MLSSRSYVSFGDSLSLIARIGYLTDLSLLLLTQQQAANICKSGVCRSEPKFMGIVLKVITCFWLNKPVKIFWKY